MKQRFTQGGIRVWTDNEITLYYRDATENESVSFTWYQRMSANAAVRMNFGRGADEEYIEERNGLTYGVVLCRYQSKG